MSEAVLDTFARRAAAVTVRRLLFGILGGAALAASLAGVFGTAAKQSPVRKVKRKNARRCQQVRNACRSILLAVPNPDILSQVALSCCGQCFAMDWLACVDAALAALEP